MSRFALIVASLAWIILASGCSDNCTSSAAEPIPHCEEDDCFPPPDNCSSRTPEHAELNIVLSEPLPRTVRVYRGAAHETGELVATHAPATKELTLLLPLGEYSVTALYVTGTDSILAVDSDELGSRELNTCTKTCLVGEPGEVDLALK
jgi:hypothetical protein